MISWGGEGLNTLPHSEVQKPYDCPSREAECCGPPAGEAANPFLPAALAMPLFQANVFRPKG